MQKENQELHQKINVIADKHPENEDEREEDIPHDSENGGKTKSDKDTEHNNCSHDAGSEEEESTKASTYTNDTRVTETEFLKKKVQTLERTVLQIPGIRKPFESARLGNYSDSPFVDQIALIDLPERFVFPVLPKYSGKTDSDEHMAERFVFPVLPNVLVD